MANPTVILAPDRDQTRFLFSVLSFERDLVAGTPAAVCISVWDTKCPVDDEAGMMIQLPDDIAGEVAKFVLRAPKVPEPTEPLIPAGMEPVDLADVPLIARAVAKSLEELKAEGKYNIPPEAFGEAEQRRKDAEAAARAAAMAEIDGQAGIPADVLKEHNDTQRKLSAERAAAALPLSIWNNRAVKIDDEGNVRLSRIGTYDEFDNFESSDGVEAFAMTLMPGTKTRAIYPIEDRLYILTAGQWFALTGKLTSEMTVTPVTDRAEVAKLDACQSAWILPAPSPAAESPSLPTPTPPGNTPSGSTSPTA